MSTTILNKYLIRLHRWVSGTISATENRSLVPIRLKHHASSVMPLSKESKGEWLSGLLFIKDR